MNVTTLLLTISFSLLIHSSLNSMQEDSYMQIDKEEDTDVAMLTLNMQHTNLNNKHIVGTKRRQSFPLSPYEQASVLALASFNSVYKQQGNLRKKVSS
jgi:hypothetical protein